MKALRLQAPELVSPCDLRRVYKRFKSVHPAPLQRGAQVRGNAGFRHHNCSDEMISSQPLRGDHSSSFAVAPPRWKICIRLQALIDRPNRNSYAKALVGLVRPNRNGLDIGPRMR